MLNQDPSCGAAQVSNGGVHILAHRLFAIDSVQSIECCPEPANHGRPADRSAAHQSLKFMRMKAKQVHLFHIAGADMDEIDWCGEEPVDRFGHCPAHRTGHDDHQISTADHVV
ncbi:MAG TPA: hypothetical protein VIR27_00050 [Mycobacteriales bacterium]